MYVFSQIQRKIILIRKEKLKKANKKTTPFEVVNRLLIQKINRN